MIGRFSFQQKLLAWDTYEAHLTDNVKRCLVQAIVQGGCTKYVQPRMLFGIKHLRRKLLNTIGEWLANGIHEYTTADNLKPVPRRMVLQ